MDFGHLDQGLLSWTRSLRPLRALHKTPRHHHSSVVTLLIGAAARHVLEIRTDKRPILLNILSCRLRLLLSALDSCCLSKTGWLLVCIVAQVPGSSFDIKQRAHTQTRRLLPRRLTLRFRENRRHAHGLPRPTFRAATAGSSNTRHTHQKCNSAVFFI